MKHTQHSTYERMYSAINDVECELLPLDIFNEVCAEIFTSGMTQNMADVLHIYFEEVGGAYYDTLHTYMYHVVTLQLHVYHFSNYEKMDWAVVRLTMDNITLWKQKLDNIVITPEPLTMSLMQRISRMYQYECCWAQGEYEFSELNYIKR